MFKSGFIAIIGRPNVGKSTLMNALIGQKVAITSPKPQTTRNKILGILTENEYQMIFTDTPGFLKPLSELDKYMTKSTDTATKDVDIILFVTDGEKNFTVKDFEHLKKYEKSDIPVVVALTKTDISSAEKILPQLSKLNELNFLKAVVPVSSLKKKNINVLKDELIKLLSEGVQYYPEDMVTDKSERFIAAELLREKMLFNYEEEIPHGVGVRINKYHLNAAKELYEIDADIVVEKQSHKPIIIGEKGQKIKKVSTEARLAFEKMLGKKVFLTLWVRVKENWRDDDFMVKDIGYDKTEL